MVEGTLPEHRRIGVGAGLAVLLGWLAAGVVGGIAGTLIVGIDEDPYVDAGRTLVHDALAPLSCLVVAAIAVSVLRWWPLVLREPRRYRAWSWIFPLAMLAAAAATADWSRITSAAAGALGALVVVVVLIAAAEELMFRGFLLQVARDRWSEGVAVLVVTIVFSLAHYVVGGFGNPLQAVVTLMSGFLYYVVRRATGLLLGAILVHAAWDFAIFSHALGAGESDGDAFTPLVITAVLALLALVTQRWLAPKPA